jgi:hypothetical protein
MAEDLASIDIYPELAHEEDLSPDFGVEIDERVEAIKEACEGMYDSIYQRSIATCLYLTE